MIEPEYYPVSNEYGLLNPQTMTGKISEESTFWNVATKYASISKDVSFVEEVAYMMVTLHRTGA